MGYTKEHTRRTRALILDTAGRLFRAHGYAGVGIDRIMNEAGLTRGGFYAHFGSKKELFQCVMSKPLGFTEELQKLSDAGVPPAQGLALALEYYLNPGNRDRTGAGCAMAALSLDATRAGPDIRTAFSGPVEDLIAEFSRRMGSDTDRATVALCTAIGALILSRATSGPLSDQVLSAAWDRLRADLNIT